MKKVVSLLVPLLLAFAAFGCSVDTEAPEEFGEQSQAFCASRPTGSLGDSTFPFGGFITGIVPDPAANWKLLNTYTRTTGTQVQARIDFGSNGTLHQARIAGTGLSGVTRITSMSVGLQPWASAPNLVRVYFRGPDANGVEVESVLTFDKRFAAPETFHWGVWAGFGEGVTHIKGAGSQRIDFTFDQGDGTSGVTSLHFTGSILEQCNIP